MSDARNKQPSTHDERRAATLELLMERGTVTVRELVDRFGVSTMTAHRDLDALAARGVVRKFRGGAAVVPTASYEGSLAFRVGEMQDAKRQIARAAARLVAPGSSIVMDYSTTALAMLPYLVEIENLTIVTNFLPIVEEVGRLGSSLTVIALGGTFNPKYNAFLGTMTAQALNDLRVDLAFVSVAAVDVARGVFHRDFDQVVVTRAMTQGADRSVLLVDSSKFAATALHRVVGVDAFDVVIVDDGTPPAVVEQLRASGVEVEVAGRGLPDDLHDPRAEGSRS